MLWSSDGLDKLLIASYHHEVNDHMHVAMTKMSGRVATLVCPSNLFFRMQYETASCVEESAVAPRVRNMSSETEMESEEWLAFKFV